GQQVRVDDVLNVLTQKQDLVRLDVRVRVLAAHLRIVVLVREEPRRPENDAVEPVLPVKKSNETLGRDFRDAVNVLRLRYYVLGDPCGRPARGRTQRVAERARR